MKNFAQIGKILNNLQDLKVQKVDLFLLNAYAFCRNLNHYFFSLPEESSLA